MKEISLRPYHGRLFLAASLKEYQQKHTSIFREPDVISCATAGRFTGGCGKDGKWTYLIWASALPQLAHEICHCVLHVFERCGIDPIAANGEPFCYMISQLMLDASDK